MCIVAIAWQLFDEMPLVLLSNRDEFYERPTKPAYQWQDAPIYAGQDVKSGGTWLGYHQQINQSNSIMSQNGRWAAVLNFRDGVQATANQRTRGELVAGFLNSELSPMQYARQIDLQAYAGFNLIVGDTRQAVVVNNRGYPPTPLHNGLHIFSNGQPESNWFKCQRLRRRVRQEVLPLIAESFGLQGRYEKGDDSYWKPSAWQVLSDTQQATDDNLPHTGMSETLEKLLSPICIDSQDMENYGTRTQSILTMRCGSSIERTNISFQPTHKSTTTNLKCGLILDSREYQSKKKPIR